MFVSRYVNDNDIVTHTYTVNVPTCNNKLYNNK